MTRHTIHPRHRFYLTEAQPCPYLEGQVERKVFTALRGEFAAAMHDELSESGFRRSQNIAYRPQCPGCNACVSVRVVANAFKPTRTQRRVINRNADLTAHVREPIPTQEQYALFQTYLEARHKDGGMAGMDPLDFASMVEDTSVETRLIEYRGSDSNKTLLAVCLTDVLSDGLSLVYSFFDPTLTRRSLGKFMILDHIQRACTLRLNYVYLGYWVGECQKMQYKAEFSPAEGLTGTTWRPLYDVIKGC